MTALPGALHYRVSAGTGCPGVSQKCVRVWDYSDCPAWRLALQGQRWDWLFRCQSDVLKCASVTPLPGALHYRVRAGTGCPGVSQKFVKVWYSSDYPAWHLALQGQHWDWLSWCQYTVAG